MCPHCWHPHGCSPTVHGLSTFMRDMSVLTVLQSGLGHKNFFNPWSTATGNSQNGQLQGRKMKIL